MRMALLLMLYSCRDGGVAIGNEVTAGHVMATPDALRCLSRKVHARFTHTSDIDFLHRSTPTDT